MPHVWGTDELRWSKTDFFKSVYYMIYYSEHEAI